MDTTRFEIVKNEFSKFKNSQYYQNRIKQSKLCPVFREVISETLKNNPLTNRHLTGLIQMFKAEGQKDNWEKYIAGNVQDKDKRKVLTERFFKIGITGYTGAGKSSISNLSQKQLNHVKTLLEKALSIDNLEDATQLIADYEKQKIPYVKEGIYSPWLHYIQPQLFPIFNSRAKDFAKWLLGVKDYVDVLAQFNDLKKELGEEDLGIIDQFIYDFEIPKIETPSENGESRTPPISNTKLNQILYGPPGTGKTYNTINIALNIIDPEFYQKNKNDRAKLVERYNKLLIKDWENMDTERIAFTTFHQSMSYEDFVEGIKPFVPDDESAMEHNETQNTNDNNLNFHIQDGIFKKMCLAAKRPDPSQFDFDAAWEEFWNFIHKSDKDVVFTSTNSKLRHIKNPENKESVKLRYLNSSENPETESKYSFYVSKEWIEKIFRKRLNIHDPNVKKWVEVRDVVGSTRATPVYAFYRKFFEYHDLDKVFSSSKLPGNFVLIIDEINRGNVSQILGELITLIEEDKREGGDEVLEVVLPYSKKPFTVPENLYIIGTMNTADRSVEALDTALRRRFSFIGMPPDPHLIVTAGALKETGGKIGDIDVVKLLETINKRLEKLIDKDHRIGHSYFMHIQNEEELKLTFKDKVIPLLEEYFFGDFGKIGLVLGNSFVEKQQNDAIFASFDAYGDGQQDLAERPVYMIRNQKEWDFVSVYQ